MRMRHPTREDEESPRADLELIAAALKDVLSFQDVEQLILVLVHM
jgi:hypothetical protein